MLKAPAQEPTAGLAGTKAKIVEAALETLRTDGFAGASARTIARRGGFNQALVFYHFGSVTNLLLAALDETSRRRMAAYQAALDKANTPHELVNVALRVYRQDLSSGHITVLAEMIAGSLPNPDFRAEILSRMDPWIDFAEAAIRKALGDSPLGGTVPTRELAYGVVALYLGIEMLTHLEPNHERVDALFSAAQSIATFVAPLMAAAGD
jgi:AcrR family transcriptional regulator